MRAATTHPAGASLAGGGAGRGGATLRVSGPGCNLPGVPRWPQAAGIERPPWRGGPRSRCHPVLDACELAFGGHGQCMPSRGPNPPGRQSPRARRRLQHSLVRGATAVTNADLCSSTSRCYSTWEPHQAAAATSNLHPFNSGAGQVSGLCQQGPHRRQHRTQPRQRQARHSPKRQRQQRQRRPRRECRRRPPAHQQRPDGAPTQVSRGSGTGACHCREKHEPARHRAQMAAGCCSHQQSAPPSPLSLHPFNSGPGAGPASGPCQQGPHLPSPAAPLPSAWLATAPTLTSPAPRAPPLPTQLASSARTAAPRWRCR
jgi:hypothetical protein